MATLSHPYDPDRLWDYVFGRLLADDKRWLHELKLTILGAYTPSLNTAVAGGVLIGNATAGTRTQPAQLAMALDNEFILHRPQRHRVPRSEFASRSTTKM